MIAQHSQPRKVASASKLASLKGRVARIVGIALLTLLCQRASAQDFNQFKAFPTVTSTVAGGNIPIGPIPVGPQVPIGDPFAIAVDHSGNVFFTDTFNFHNIVRKLDTGGNLTIIAGGGATPGTCAGHTNAIGDGCLATEAVLSSPSGVGIDSAGNIFINDTGHNALREVTIADGKIHTIVDTANNNPEGGFFGPVGMAIDSNDNIFVSDPSHNNIIKVTPAGVASIFKGGGAISAPEGLAMDAADNLYVANATALQVLKISSAGAITQTFTLTTIPEGVAVDTTGAVYYTPGTGNAFISAADNTTKYVGGGSGCAGQTDLVGDGCTGTQAIIKSVRNGVFDSNNVLFVADLGNSRIRHVARSGTVAGIVTSVAGNGTPSYGGDGGPATDAFLNTPWGGVIDASGNFVFADQLNNLVRKIDSSGNISIFAGTAPTNSTAITICDTTQTRAALGDGGSATAGFLCTPELQPPAFDTTGNLYFVDFGSETSGTNPDIRKVTTGGTITNVSTGATTLSGPSTVAVDGSNNIFVADFTANKIYRGTTAGGSLTLVAGGGLSPGTCSGSTNSIGDGCFATQAKLNAPYATIDANDNIFIADSFNNRIRKVDHTTQVITTIAGTGTAGFNGDLTGAATQLSTPDGLALDTAGNVLIADTLNSRIRLLTGGVASGSVTTLVGGGTGSCATATDTFGDGCSATNAMLNAPTGVTFNTFGDLFITDGTGFRIRKVVYLPISNAQNLSTPENVALPLTLTALSPRTGTTGFTFSVTAAANGTVTLNNATLGTVTYTPSVGFAGADTFTFTANDGHASSASATVTVIVVAPPTITKSFGTTPIPRNGNTALTFQVANPPQNVVPVTGVAFTDNLPAGVVVNTPNGLSGSCGGGTITATAGSGSVSLSGATLAVNSNCAFSVNVTGATDGVFLNTTNAIASTNGGTGGTASDTLTIINPPSITKSFGASSIPLNGTTNLSFNLSSSNANLTLNGIAFTDSLLSGLVVAATPNLNNTCGGVATAVAGSSSVSLTGATLTPGASCMVSVNVQGTTAGVKNNSVQVTSTNGGTGNTSNAGITVVGPPVIIKAFGAASIPLSGATSLSFTIQNNNTTTALSGVAFTDTLPAGLVVSTPNGLSGSCGGGTITATPGTGTISLSSGTIAATSSCTFSVNVTGVAAGTQNNTTGNVASTEGGTGGTASASLSVVVPPSIAKVFNPSTIALNGTTSLTFTITNPASNSAGSNGVAFTDSLPAGLVVSTPNGLSNTCGGTATATAGSGTISLTGGTVATNSSCTVTVNVTGTASGNYTNTTGAVSSTNGGTGNTATANLTVAAPPSITKSFGAASIPLNGTTALTFNITNPNTNVALTGLAFTDNLPAGLVVGPTPGVSNTCGGTVTAIAGAGSISLSGGTLASSATCALSANVQGTTAGMKNNSVTVTSTDAGVGNTSNTSITVVGPPVIIKAFGASSIPLNGSTSLSFTIQNNNTTTPLSGVGFTDTLPAGLVVMTPNGLTGSCGGGTITATAGTGTISLANASLTSSSSCTFSANVTGVAGGQKNNTTGNVTSAEGGTGGTASASLSVEAPPSIAKAFNPAAIAVNGTSTLTITITNPAGNPVAASGVAFTDNLPAGLVVATPNGLTNTCGGTATATAGSGTISLAGGTIAANSSCTASANVTAAAAGTYVNTTGAVSSTNGGTGNTATATLTVQPADLAIAKTHVGNFAIGQTGAQWTITVNNAGAGPTTGTVTVVDTLPNVVNPPVPTAISGTGWTCTLATLTCTRSDVLAPGGAYPPITLTVNIPSNIQNSFTNTATVSGGGEVNNTNDTSSDLTFATLPAAIAKAFGATSLGLGASTNLTFTITNPNATAALTGVAFTDTLPTGLVVSTPNGLAGSCGGAVTAAAGSGSVSLNGGNVAAAGNCTISVNVTAAATGTQVNTTGPVTAANAGTGNTATATITVPAPDLTITKSHTGNFFQGETGATYTLTVSNAGPGPTFGTVTVVDTLPAGLTATAMAGTGWTCTLNSLTCTRTDALAAGASYPAITITVNVATNAPATVTNTAAVSGGGELNTANDSASDTTTITPPPDFTLSLTIPTITIRAGQTATYVITATAKNNALPNPLTFTASGFPAKTSFAFNPASLNLGTTPASTSFSVSTTAGDPFVASNATRNRLPLYALFLPLSSMILAGLGFGKRQRRKGWLIAALFVVGGLGLFGCAGAQKNFQNLGTPAGTYTITVTATSGAIQHSAPVTLVVQP